MALKAQILEDRKSRTPLERTAYNSIFRSKVFDDFAIKHILQWNTYYPMCLACYLLFWCSWAFATCGQEMPKSAKKTLKKMQALSPNGSCNFGVFVFFPCRCFLLLLARKCTLKKMHQVKTRQALCPKGSCNFALLVVFVVFSWVLLLLAKKEKATKHQTKKQIANPVPTMGLACFCFFSRLFLLSYWLRCS